MRVGQYFMRYTHSLTCKIGWTHSSPSDWSFSRYSLSTSSQERLRFRENFLATATGLIKLITGCLCIFFTQTDKTRKAIWPHPMQLLMLSTKNRQLWEFTLQYRPRLATLFIQYMTYRTNEQRTGWKPEMTPDYEVQPVEDKRASLDDNFTAYRYGSLLINSS